jgi:vacuolar-type H+-ATPase subunit D/Vma8
MSLGSTFRSSSQWLFRSSTTACSRRRRVDRALADLRDLNRARAEVDVPRQQHDILQRELTKIIQRVNLFEKIKIPEALEAIRVIRIHLGDEMTAAVGRAKIAKAKLSASSTNGKVPSGEAGGDGVRSA